MRIFHFSPLFRYFYQDFRLFFCHADSLLSTPVTLTINNKAVFGLSTVMWPSGWTTFNLKIGTSCIMGSCQKSVFACSPKVRNSWDEMSHSLASAKNNSCYLFALFMLYLYVSTEMERVFNLKQVHRPIQLNCSGLWESKQKKYFDNTPLFYLLSGFSGYFIDPSAFGISWCNINAKVSITKSYSLHLNIYRKWSIFEDALNYWELL